MLERRISLLCLHLGFLICLGTSVHALACLASKDHPESVRSWPQESSIVVAKRRIEDEQKNVGLGGRTKLPIPTPTISSMTTTTSFPSGPTSLATGLPCVLSRRLLVNNNALVTMSSLSSALASATASAWCMSQEFASSLEELQSAAEVLVASASSALLAASSAVAAAEASASKAVLVAQESAASSVRQAMAEATPISMSFTGALAEATYTRTQTQMELEAAEVAAMSVTRAAVAIVLSIVVAALCSILGFYLFIRYRRARRKRQQEEGGEEKAQKNPVENPAEPLVHRQEHEVDHELSATEALARAVISYIEKEQMPTPATPATPIIPPIPATPATPADPPCPSPSSSERRKIGFAVGGEVDDPFWVQQHPPPSHPPPQTPVRSAHKESSEIIRRTPSHRSAQSDKSIYGEIIIHPLECVPTNESASRAREDGGCYRERDEMRDSNWPLPKPAWL